MNYWTILIFTFLSISFSRAEERKSILSYVLTSSELDTVSLLEEEALYTFTFEGLIYLEERKDPVEIIPIHYSIDGVEQKVPFVNGRELSIMTTPGKHIFQFYYTSNYSEVYTDSLAIAAQYHDHYTVYMQSSMHYEEAEKPVIYLYPQKTTEVEFKINIKGNYEFLYPPYDQSWKFIAQPNGELEFGDKAYNYLFWEASNVAPLTGDDLSTGFIVEGGNITHFLEEKLTEAGLSTKEQADFITYWAPRMQANNYNFVHFVFNETCDRYATFDITPKPDNIYRIYMVWTEVSAPHPVEPQTIETINREGFTVLEWGGQQTHFERHVCRFPYTN